MIPADRSAARDEFASTPPVDAALVEAVHAQAVEGHGRHVDAGALEVLVRRHRPLAGAAEVDAVANAVLARIRGFGALDAHLADPDVTDVMVNGDGSVWIDRGGVVEPTGVRLTAGEVDQVIERMLGPVGRRVDWSAPTADARLPDGSRVHVVIPPVAVDGPTVTIRRFRALPVELDEWGSPDVAALLADAVRARANLLVSGATGAGKTTLLNTLAALVDPGDRVVTIEDAAELRLPLPDVVRLEARPAGLDGSGRVDVRELVRNALRMRPDRIVVGEVRSGEAFDMVQAMLTGHDGCLATVHAHRALDALARLETLCLLADVGPPLELARRQVAAAIDLVVHVARDGRGRRSVVEVGEVVHDPDGPAIVPLVDQRGVVAAPTRHRARGPITGSAPPPAPTEVDR